MFIFSFIGGLVSPYGQDQVFYRDDIQMKEYAALSEIPNTASWWRMGRSSVLCCRRR